MSAELLGVPAEVEHEGKVYRLGPATQKAKGILEELLASNAVKAVIGLKQHLPPAEYEQARDGIVKAVGSGAFKTGSKNWLESLATVDGGIAFHLSLFRVNHPDMTAAECADLLTAQPDQCTAAMARIAPSFFDLAFPNLTPEMRETIQASFRNA